MNSNADIAIVPCKRARIDDGDSDVACQVAGVNLTEDSPVDLSHHKHCLAVEDDVGKENAFGDEKKKLRSLQDDLRNEETKLALLRKIRCSQQNTRSHAGAARAATNGPKMAAGLRAAGQQVLSNHHNGSANLKAPVLPLKGNNTPPVAVPVASRTLLQPSSQQSRLAAPAGGAGHQATPGSRGADSRAWEGVESRSFAASHLQQTQQHSKLALTPHQKEQLAAQRQVAAKQALRKQLERTLLQIPPPKPPPPTMSLVPNATSAEFVILLGLEEAVKAIVLLDQRARSPAGPSSDDGGAKAPFLCCQCGIDFTPLWKLDKGDPPSVVCEHCVASNRKRALKQQHTNYLKSAFVKALQQEQEMEKCFQSFEAQRDGVTGPSKSYAKAAIGSGRIQATDPGGQHTAIPAAHQLHSRVSGAYPYDRSVVYHGKSLSSHRSPLGSKDSTSLGKTLHNRGIPFGRT